MFIFYLYVKNKQSCQIWEGKMDSVTDILTVTSKNEGEYSRLKRFFNNLSEF